MYIYVRPVRGSDKKTPDPILGTGPGLGYISRGCFCIYIYRGCFCIYIYRGCFCIYISRG
ncbi:hypothetical protein T492DRAFT_934055, partial [Pavlovales sp. CCMP2436]